MLSEVQWIDFGTEASLKYLGEGWGPPESSEAGSFAYATALKSTLIFWADSFEEIKFAFRAKAFSWRHSPLQNITILVNGVEVGHAQLGIDFSIPLFEISADVIRAGENILTFNFAWTKSPYEIGLSSDKRQLSAFFDYAVFYRDERSVEKFLREGITVLTKPTEKSESAVIKMPNGLGIRYRRIPIVRGAKLKFKVFSSFPSDTVAEVILKPEGKPPVTLFSADEENLNKKDEDFSIPLSSFAPSRGDIVFRVRGESGSGYVMWQDPRIIAEKPNVILIVADALRPDRLGCYDGPLSTPHIDSLAEDGVLFRNAFTHYPATPPSFSSIFTGKIPPSHGVRKLTDRLSEEEETIAETMNGFYKNRGGFPALSILSAGMGFAQGFTYWETKLFEEMDTWILEADQVNAELFSWIEDKTDEGFFAFVHYADAHEPYSAPQDFELALTVEIGSQNVFTKIINRSGPLEIPAPQDNNGNEIRLVFSVPERCRQRQGSDFIELKSFDEATLSLFRANDSTNLEKGIHFEVDKPKLFVLNPSSFSSQTKNLKFFLHVTADGENSCPGGNALRAYDREIEFLDTKIGELIQILKNLGIYDHTVIVFTADHGEAFSEHKKSGHINGVYDEFLRVPLIIRAPWVVPKGKKVKTMVMLSDIAPTILDIIGMPSLPEADGTSLLTAIKQKPERHLFAETYTSEEGIHMMALRSDEWKLICIEECDKVELYNLKSDPKETSNVVAEYPAIARAMIKILKNLSKNESLTPSQGIPDLLKKQLKAMGYIE